MVQCDAYIWIPDCLLEHTVLLLDLLLEYLGFHDNVHSNLFTFGTNCSRMVQVELVEDSL